ncbi:putative transposase [Vibrio mimicus]|nr:putative transposase [Vibrio mimicus]
MKIPMDLSDNISTKAPQWQHLLKQSATRLPTKLTADPELVWALKHRRNVLLNIIADRCTSNLILRYKD